MNNTKKTKHVKNTTKAYHVFNEVSHTN